MSSFNINGPSSNQPMVQSSQGLGKDGGGGGNTGYMNMRGGKKKSSSNSDEDNSVFLEEELEDTFEKEGSKKEKGSPKKENKLTSALSKFIKNKTQKETPVETKDAFIKSTDNHEPEKDFNMFNNYDIPKENTNDPFQNNEYDIVDDDEYYGNINV